jgi:thymidylate synthase (FAD)
MKVKLLSYTANPEKVVCMAGKLCYAGCSIDELEENLTEENIKKFVNMLISIGHESPLEHISFTFAVEGVSRVTEQQLTRHRIASYSIQSGRYVERDNAEFTKPQDIQNDNNSSFLFDEVVNISKNNYQCITEELMIEYITKFARNNNIEGYIPSDYFDSFKESHPKEYNQFKKKAIENARMVFPNSLQTKIIFTMNLRTLINFFEHRCCMRSQDEIRELANEMLKLCREVSPILFNRLGASCKVKGCCPEGNMQCDEFKNIVPTLKELIDTRLKYKNLVNSNS